MTNANSDPEDAGQPLSAAGEGHPRWKELTAAARYVSGGYDDPATYQRLAEVLAECDRRHGTAGNRDLLQLIVGKESNPGTIGGEEWAVGALGARKRRRLETVEGSNVEPGPSRAPADINEDPTVP